MLQLSEPQATAIAAPFSRPPAGQATPHALGYDRLLPRPDQWTLELPSLFPLHRIRSGSDVLYVSDRTAEVVMETTATSRFWGTSGAVFHWLYFTPLRSHSTLWRQLVVWASAAGCALTLSGLTVGLIRLTRRKRSPYSGIMRWHHYSGLVFGAAAFTWVLSGALSMDPSLSRRLVRRRSLRVPGYSAAVRAPARCGRKRGVVIVLLLGGLFSAASSFVPAAKTPQAPWGAPEA